MNQQQAKNLLMKPKSEEHLAKVLESISKNKRPIVLNSKGLIKIVNKIIAYEYIINNYIINEDTIEMLRQDTDGVWVSYFSGNKKEYAKVWFTSANPNLREIFFKENKDEIKSN